MLIRDHKMSFAFPIAPEIQSIRAVIVRESNITFSLNYIYPTISPCALHFRGNGKCKAHRVASNKDLLYISFNIHTHAALYH